MHCKSSVDAIILSSEMQSVNLNDTPKQALLITAYRDEVQLLRLLKPFLGKMRIFIHIDRKSRDLSVDRIQKLQLPYVEIISKYQVCWGSINHVFAILDLMKMALKYDDIAYCHIVSGQDQALHSASWFFQEFSSEKKNSFFCDRNMLAIDSKIRREWYELYHLPSTWDHRNKWIFRIERVLLWLQRLLKIRRKKIGELPLDNLRVSLVWGSCARGACETILRFVAEHPKFMRASNLTKIPEEMIIATALSFSEYSIIDTQDQSYRYMEWNSGRGTPATLDDTDWPEVKRRIEEGGCAFIRKIDSLKSKGLILRLEEYLENEKCC